MDKPLLALLVLCLVWVVASDVAATTWAVPQKAPTPILAATATPVVPPAATAVLANTLEPKATAIPPTATRTPLPAAATAAPVVAAWAPPTPSSLLPGWSVSLDSPAVAMGLALIGGVALAAMVLLATDLVRRRRCGGQPVKGAPRALAPTHPVLQGNRYVLIEKVGSGGLGEVYKAVDDVLGRVVAVKLVRAEGVPFYEARIMAQMQHPNIAAVYDIGEWDDRFPLYVVMEFLNGTPLDKVLEGQRGKPLDDELVLKVATGVLRALVHAHGKGIVHRDLKPSNVMLLGTEADRQVKVLDFGLAYTTRNLQAIPHSTREGNLVGTLQYMAPEQIRGERPSAATDLYAFGVLLFYMVTGQLPYRGRTPKAIALEHLHATIPDPRAFRPGLRHEVAELLMALLSKNPGQRPRSAAETLRVLEGLGGRLTVGDSSPHTT